MTNAGKDDEQPYGPEDALEALDYEEVVQECMERDNRVCCVRAMMCVRVTMRVTLDLHGARSAVC